MFTIQALFMPETVEDAYQTLISRRNNVVLGGCTFLRLGHSKIGTAIDLSKLNLEGIDESSYFIEIGAMTTLREIEVHQALNRNFCGAIPKAVANIIGIQFRNIATVGASVYSKYGFSDLITALLALDTEVELYGAGRMTLRAFLEKPYERDILTKIYVLKNHRKAGYQSARLSASDYPVLTLAASILDGEWLISVGARPSRAKLADKASAILTNGLSPENIEKAAKLVTEELEFGTNPRGTAEYRRELCRVLAKRAIAEVSKCK